MTHMFPMVLYSIFSRIQGFERQYFYGIEEVKSFSYI